MARTQPQPKTELAQPSLTESRDSARQKLQTRIALGEELLVIDIMSQEVLEENEKKARKWRDYNEELLRTLFTNDKFAQQYVQKSRQLISSFSFEPNLREDIADHRDFLKRHLAALESILERLDLIQEPSVPSPTSSATAIRVASQENLLEKTLKRFDRVARQLKRRHGNRATLDITDEYDVQDLLHALLRLNFDDVRPEEWTPSYAGGSSRMDFLLKNEQIVVEAKKTRPNLLDRQLGEELLIDIGRYKASPDCGTLVCFIYDPEGLVHNPHGLIRDLQQMSSPELKVRVIISPEN